MWNIGALVSAWKASTADLMVSRENFKTHVTWNALNETSCFDEVIILEVMLVGFNYWFFLKSWNYTDKY